jgi:MFS transporter, ACDE family, multidrug resistance protein
MNSNSQTPSSLFQDKNFYITNSVTLVAIMGGIIVAPSLPSLATTFRVQPQQMEWVMSAFLIPAALTTPIFGVLADRIGRKQVLVPALLLFAIAGGFAAFAQDFTTLVWCRFFQGVGAASLDLIALTMLGDLYHGRMMVTVMSFNAVLIGMSGTLYPLLGGLLASLSWRYPFLLFVVAIPIALLVLMVLKLPKQPKAAKTSLKSYFKTTFQSLGNRSVFGLFVAIAVSFMLEFGAFTTYLSILGGSTFGAATWVVGIILASKAISMSLLAPQLEKLTERFSAISLIRLSFVISAIALVIVPSIHNVWMLLIPNVLFGAALCLALPSSQALLAGLAAQDARGGIMSANMTVQAIGQALGPIVAGIAFSLWGMQGVFFASAGLALVASTAFNYLVTPKPQVEMPMPMPQSAVQALPPKVKTVMNEPIRTQVQAMPAAHTVLQLQKAQLVHTPSNRTIDLPSTLPLIHIGKPNDRIPPDIDLSQYPNAQVVSRTHADLRVEGENYYLQDSGSANGTLLNNNPLLPGNWYKLRSGDRITFGKGRLVNFLFQIAE